jgi:hypothetical protein
MWRRVLGLSPIRTAVASGPIECEVHLLCSERDYLSALWALRSFYSRVGNLPLPLTIHLDNAVPSKAIRRLRRQFPDARIIERAQADAIIMPILKERKLVRLAAARSATAFILKLTDFALLSDARNLISFDSDVLFFSKPEELLQAAGSDFKGALVQVDLQSVYNIDAARAQSLGWQLPERVNTGIMAFERRGIDLDACEALLADPELARTTGWIEQTLYALLLARGGQLKYLPPSYTIPVPGDRWRASGVVARHYAGLSRPLLTLEGMPSIFKQVRA